MDRSALQPHYDIPLDRKVVLLGLTWHHGGSLGHWGDEESLLVRLFQHIEERGAVSLLRMHDRHRYPKSYAGLLERVARRFPRSVMLKWKEQAPSSLADLLLSDVCVSNHSSLLNAYYYTERPSIHIDPHDARSDKQRTYKMFMGLPIPRSLQSADQLWKLSPDENGGLRAQSFEQLLSQLDVALHDPACCTERARGFIARYVSGANGDSCARAARMLASWVAARSLPEGLTG